MSAPTSAPLDFATVAAIATAPGRGAVALLRVSGPAAFEVARRVASPWPDLPRRATLCALRDPRDGRLLDRALVTRFSGPDSYTGEDVVELATHGGSVVPASVLAALVAAGAEPAGPGEFTRRAVLHGRMDLVQAEAVGDLVDARSGAMQAAALAQLDGGLSRRVAALRDRLLDVEALLAYEIDFPEEDEGPLARGRVAEAAERARDGIALLATAPAAAAVRDGAAVVIAGAPNAGKSSLFNALLGERRAIVTEVAGTTRDAIEAVLDARPWPLRLVDTAGLRATSDVVERLGIEVSEGWLARAAVVLACGETLDDVARTTERVQELTAAPVLGVWTKRDGEGRRSALGARLSAEPPTTSDVGRRTLDGVAVAESREPSAEGDLLEVSAETGRGLRELLGAVQALLARGLSAPPADVPLVTRARHERALGEARAEVELFLAAWAEGALPAPVAAVHVRAAVGALDDLIGAVDVEEILGRVFATFCVGK